MDRAFLLIVFVAACVPTQADRLMAAPGSPLQLPASPRSVAALPGEPWRLAVLAGSDLFIVQPNDHGLSVQQRVELPDRLRPHPHLIRAGDLNGDGVTDLAVTAHDSNEIVLLWGDAQGGFQLERERTPVARHRGEAHNHELELADVDDDGDLDLITGNEGAGDVSVLLNAGSGVFRAAPDSPYAAIARAYPFAVGAINADAHADLAVPSLNGQEIAILYGLGDGRFAQGQRIRTDRHPFNLSLGDLNGDDDADLVVSHNGGSRLSVHLGDGQGRFVAGQSIPIGEGVWHIALADFTGDGVLDVAGGTRRGTVEVWSGQGDGRFQPLASLASGQGVWTVMSADLGSDGAMDLVALGADDNTLWVWLQP